MRYALGSLIHTYAALLGEATLPRKLRSYGRELCCSIIAHKGY
ncbi:hypothetical protein [uncultured Helicobacter sp.]